MPPQNTKLKFRAGDVYLQECKRRLMSAQEDDKERLRWQHGKARENRVSAFESANCETKVFEILGSVWRLRLERGTVDRTGEIF